MNSQLIKHTLDVKVNSYTIHAMHGTQYELLLLASLFLY